MELLKDLLVESANIDEIQNKYQHLPKMMIQAALDIKKDCQPYLRQVNHKPFTMYPAYRGVSSSVTFGQKRVRLENRTPSDTPVAIHDSINEYFSDSYGHPFRNGLFVTSNSHTASNYGKLYYVVPIGPVESLWGKGVADLFMVVDEVFDEVHKQHPHMDGTPENRNLVTNAMMKKVHNISWQHNKLLQGLSTTNEVMLWCSRYYIINAEAMQYKQDEELEAIIQP